MTDEGRIFTDAEWEACCDDNDYLNHMELLTPLPSTPMEWKLRIATLEIIRRDDMRELKEEVLRKAREATVTSLCQFSGRIVFV